MGDELKVERRGSAMFIDGVEYVSKATMLERIDAKTAQADALKEQLDQARATVKESNEKAAKYDALEREFGEFKASLEREEAFGLVGLQAAADATPEEAQAIQARRERLQKFWKADQADVEEGKRVALKDWLQAQRGDPLLGHLFPSPSDDRAGADTPQAPGGPGAANQPKMPDLNRGGPRQPAPARKLTPEQINAELANRLASAGGDAAKVAEARTWFNQQVTPANGA